jgi:hypothetical protein
VIDDVSPPGSWATELERRGNRAPNNTCDYAEIGDPVCPAAEKRDALAARLAEAERAIKDANEALHGYGVEDQGQAYDKACQILDAYTPETVDGGEQ